MEADRKRRAWCFPVQLIDDLADVGADQGLEQGQHPRIATVRLQNLLIIARPLRAKHIDADAGIVGNPIAHVTVTIRRANGKAATLGTVGCVLERGNLIGVENVLDYCIAMLAEALVNRFWFVKREGQRAGPVTVNWWRCDYVAHDPTSVPATAGQTLCAAEPQFGGIV